MNIPDGLASIKDIREAIGEAESRQVRLDYTIKAIEDLLKKCNSTCDSLKQNASVYNRSREQLETTLQEIEDTPVVLHKMNRHDSKKLAEDIRSALTAMLDASEPFSGTTDSYYIVKNMRDLLTLEKESQERFIRQLNALLSHTTAHELSEYFASTRGERKSIGLGRYYAGVAGTVLVYLVTVIILSLQDGVWSGIFVPLVPVGMVVGLLMSQIAAKTRMDEEYRHKETFLKTYVGFSNSLEEEDRMALTKKAIEVVGRNPASTLSLKESWLHRLRRDRSRSQ